MPRRLLIMKHYVNTTVLAAAVLLGTYAIVVFVLRRPITLVPALDLAVYLLLLLNSSFSLSFTSDEIIQLSTHPRPPSFGFKR